MKMMCLLWTQFMHSAEKFLQEAAMVHIEPRFFFLGALLLLTLPLNWIWAAFLAAGFHELCHLTAVRLLGGKVHEICLDVGGAQIGATIPGRLISAAASLAGPAGSLLLVLLCRSFPRVAICGCIQGIYNLLPFRCLDGGRAMESLLEWLWPQQASWIMKAVELAAAVVLAAAAIYAAWSLSLSGWPLIWIVLFTSGMIQRKFPCKRR